MGRGAWQAALLALVGLGKGHTYIHMVCQLAAMCPHDDVREDFLLHHIQLHGSNFGLTALVGVELSLKGRRLPAEPALKLLLQMQSAPGTAAACVHALCKNYITDSCVYQTLQVCGPFSANRAKLRV